jgi:hypothetical protein
MVLVRSLVRGTGPLAVMLGSLLVTGCDLEVRAHADVPFGSRTVHVSYSSGGSGGAKAPGRP